jgi:hypothetical protein
LEEYFSVCGGKMEDIGKGGGFKNIISTRLVVWWIFTKFSCKKLVFIDLKRSDEQLIVISFVYNG